MAKKLVTFGSSLKKIRLSMGLTQEDIANVIGVSIAYVSDIERGQRAPFQDDDIKKLCKKFPDAMNYDEMIQLAKVSRPKFILETKNASSTKLSLGAKIQDMWPFMTDVQASRILDFISREG